MGIPKAWLRYVPGARNRLCSPGTAKGPHSSVLHLAHLLHVTQGELEGSLDTLVGMATSLGATASLVRTFRGAHGRMCALMHIQEGTMDEARYTDLRVAGEWSGQLRKGVTDSGRANDAYACT
jgi:hypothetical protein